MERRGGESYLGVPPALSPLAGAERFPSKMKGRVGKCLREDGKQSRQRTHTCVNTVNSGGSERRGACVCAGFFFLLRASPDGCGAAGKRRRDVGG